MNQPEVQIGDCIRVGDKRACVLIISENGDIYAGYFQYEGRGRNPKPWNPIKSKVVWEEGEGWVFKSTGPDGSYVRDYHEESMIRRCYS